MLHRVLAREGVDERRRKLFLDRGITTQRQLIQHSTWEVAHAVDLSVQEMKDLLARVSIRLAPPSHTAFDLFLENVNHPTFLRTGLVAIDHALNGGLQCRSLSELVGIAGIGKSQCAMTLAVLCAMEYAEHSVMYFDAEHNFSAKRLLQIAKTRLRLRKGHSETDVSAMAAAVVNRVRVMKVNSIATFSAKLKEVEDVMHSMKVKLLVVDCVATLFLKDDDLTHAQRQHQMLRVARDLKLFADSFQAFAVVTNRASTIDGEGEYSPKPWITFILERHALHRAMTIVKSPVAGHIVQPFTISESGVEDIADPETSHVLESQEFAMDDDLLRDVALSGLPAVDPVNTLRSTQQSVDSIDSKTTELDIYSDDEDSENEDAHARVNGFDLVPDSNEEEDEAFYRDVVEE